MKFLIKALSLSLSLGLLAACNGGGESGSDGGSKVSINSVSVAQGGRSVSSVNLENESTPISLQWSVSFSSITNLYSMTVTAAPGTSAAKRLIYQNCSNSADSLYNCGTTGDFECLVSNNRLNCRVNNIGSAPAFSSSVDSISFRACVYDSGLNEVCDERRLAVSLLLASGTGTGTGTGTSTGTGTETGIEAGIEAGTETGTDPGTGPGTDLLLPNNTRAVEPTLRSDLIPPMPSFTLQE